MYIRISLWCASLPRIFVDVTKIVFEPCETGADAIDKIEAELRAIEMAVLDWRNELTVSFQSRRLYASSAERNYKLELDTAGLGILAITCRLMSAISVDRLSPELRSLGYAKELKGLMDVVRQNSPRTAFYLKQKIVMPDAILDSTDYWLRPSAVPRRVIERCKFRAWSERLSGIFLGGR